MPAAPLKPARPRIRGLLLGAVLGAFLALPGVASAGVLSNVVAKVTSNGCAAKTTTQRFSQYNDASWYWQVPASNAWTLTGAAAQTGTGFTVPAGASVTSPALCVGIDSPTLRLIGKGAAGSRLRIEVLPATGLPLAVGTFTASPNSTPSEITLMVANITATITGDVRVRLTSTGGTVALDELWIDPFKRV